MNTETFNQQVPIALVAIAENMIKHVLPIPIDIDINRVAQTILVRVPGQDEQSAWLNTLIVEDEVNETPSMRSTGWVKTTWTVRLPDSGIGFQIRGLRKQALALVSA